MLEFLVTLMFCSTTDIESCQPVGFAIVQYESLEQCITREEVVLRNYLQHGLRDGSIEEGDTYLVSCTLPVDEVSV